MQSRHDFSEVRPLAIAGLVAAAALALLAAETMRNLLAPPMPSEMACVIHRNCPDIDYLRVGPLIAPKMSEIRPLVTGAKAAKQQQSRR
jgi:hypothetical protein